MHDARPRVPRLPVRGCRQPQEKDAFALTFLLDETNRLWKPRRSHILARMVRWYHLPVPREKIIDYVKQLPYARGPIYVLRLGEGRSMIRLVGEDGQIKSVRRDCSILR